MRVSGTMEELLAERLPLAHEVPLIHRGPNTRCDDQVLIIHAGALSRCSRE